MVAIGYGVLDGKGVLLAFEDLTGDGCSTIGWWPKLSIGSGADIGVLQLGALCFYFRCMAF